jgi:hypothetical protein
VAASPYQTNALAPLSHRLRHRPPKHAAGEVFERGTGFRRHPTGACPMAVYKVSKVDTITEGRHLFYGFNVIGVHGQLLISFSFETRMKNMA